jgi:hypothetical protein
MVAAFSAALFGQVAEPEFNDLFFGLSQGQLVKLERQSGSIHVKMSGPFSAKGSFAIPGAKSPVRFPSGVVTLAVRPASNEDPEAWFHLRRLESKKHTREASIVKASVIGASVKDPGIPMEFAKYGTGSLKVTAMLEPGEYAVGHAGGQTVFCFGVD